MGFTIRTPKNDDYLSIEKLYTQKKGQFIDDREKINFRRYLNLNSRLIKVAVNKTELLGYVIGYQNNERKARIFNIYVKPLHRKKRIGSDLLHSYENFLLNDQLNLEYLSVGMSEKYFSSIGFFEKSGFNLITKINIYKKNDMNFPFAINPNVIIRQATYDDIQELREIEDKSFSRYWRFSSEDFIFRILSERNSFFVALIDKKIVGYNYNTLSLNGTDGYYVRIATHPNYRQKQISTTLTSNAINWFRLKNVRRISLSTYADSKVHNQMYQSWGFKFSEHEIILAKKFI